MFYDAACDILHDYHKMERSENEVEEKQRLGRAAAGIIRNDIKDTNSGTSMYFKPSKIGSNETMKDILPDSLIVFPDQLFCYRKSNSNLDVKKLFIGQAIMQCIHPKPCVCPLQVALGVTVHNLCGSELLVTILNKLCFFERNVSVLSQPDESLLSDRFANDTDSEEIFPLFAADNADHQIQSLHGKGTFHGMGIIICVTPSRKVEHILRR